MRKVKSRYRTFENFIFFKDFGNQTIRKQSNNIKRFHFVFNSFESETNDKTIKTTKQNKKMATKKLSRKQTRNKQMAKQTHKVVTDALEIFILV